MIDDIQKASAAHFQSTGRFISLENPVRRLYEVVLEMKALAEDDASNNLQGGDEVLMMATSAKDSLHTLVSNFGKSENNIIGGGKIVDSLEDQKEDGDIEDSSELFEVE